MFDTILMVDWSGGNDRGATPARDAIWTCLNGADPMYHRNRQVAETYLCDILDQERAVGRRVLAGFDLCFGYPAGLAQTLIGKNDPLALWDWFETRVQDSPKGNNRFDLAAEINRHFPGVGPFWFNNLNRDIADLPRKASERHGHGLPEARATDQGAFSPWQLGGAGAVGSQVIMGLPTLSRLRKRYQSDLAVWPFQPADAQIVLAETYFSQLPVALAQAIDPIKDAAQVRTYADTFAQLSTDQWDQLLNVPPTSEGWVLGRGHTELLESIAANAPPPLRNDCFAMPRGADWTPVTDALDHLRCTLNVTTSPETAPVAESSKRILAADVLAKRSHPPHPNAAVDGYGFAGPAPRGVQSLSLIEGRAAAGAPFDGAVPNGHAIRILTGANIPQGVDTVILQEDVRVQNSKISFHGPLKKGSNCRKGGEDMKAGHPILHKGRQLTPADLGTITAAGVATVPVQSRLRVGVLSTGDELRDADEAATDANIYDANRPMLLDIIRTWGFSAIDLGRAPDDRARLAKTLSQASARSDVILTSGGASAGEEDHMSALLQDTGSFALWRIAIKPGRPLALGLWNQTPILALPGNPVAAFVCTLIFARPALFLMAGAIEREPQGFDVPAAFAKSKKQGRCEYLRARIENGQAQCFPSEGSGRVSGLSWATGLIALPHEACDIAIGDPVRFIPFESFGL